MRIHEAAGAVGCTQRAIKFYEEKGLLPAVSRSENGYRDYTDEDIRLLHEIQAYRKLGISITDIKALLSGDKQALLKEILAAKQADAAERQAQIRALEAFLSTGDQAELNDAIDFESISQAMRAQLPGFFGLYLSRHFAPYLNTPIHTEEQKDAYTRILAFWDNPSLRLPLLYRISAALSICFPAQQTEMIDAQIKAMLNPNEETYAHIRERTLKTVRLRENPLVRMNPFEAAKRQMMRSLRNCGYYDLFIPQMKRLSPSYKAYHDALTALNDRLCDDLGLYYDADFNLRLKR